MHWAGNAVLDVSTWPRLGIQIRCSTCVGSTRVRVRLDLSDTNDMSTSKAVTEVTNVGSAWVTTTLDYSGKATHYSGGSVDFAKIEKILIFVNAGSAWSGTLEIGKLSLGSTRLLGLWMGCRGAKMTVQTVPPTSAPSLAVRPPQPRRSIFITLDSWYWGVSDPPQPIFNTLISPKIKDSSVLTGSGIERAADRADKETHGGTIYTAPHHQPNRIPNLGTIQRTNNQPHDCTKPQPKCEPNGRAQPRPDHASHGEPKQRAECRAVVVAHGASERHADHRCPVEQPHGVTVLESLARAYYRRAHAAPVHGLVAWV